MDREIAYAKINLALHVRRRRADGYHDLETLFAFCADGDVVEAEAAATLSLTIDGAFAEGLSTTDNLVMRAAAKLSGDRGAAIRLTKNLPVAAGIGGGSADAAATLRLLSRMWGIDTDLPVIATELGADVPACLASVTVRGEGRGDALYPIEADVTGTPVLLVNPRTPLATAPVFKAWDGVDRGPLGEWRTGRNDLETPARALVPAIGVVLDWLYTRPGVTLTRMSGSGATCLALFDEVDFCDRAAIATARDHPDWWCMASVLR